MTHNHDDSHSYVSGVKAKILIKNAQLLRRSSILLHIFFKVTMDCKNKKRPLVVIFFWWSLRIGGLWPFPLWRARNKFLCASSLHRTRLACSPSRREYNQVKSPSGGWAFYLVIPAGVEPAIFRMRTWCPGPLDEGTVTWLINTEHLTISVKLVP